MAAALKAEEGEQGVAQKDAVRPVEEEAATMLQEESGPERSGENTLLAPLPSQAVAHGQPALSPTIGGTSQQPALMPFMISITWNHSLWQQNAEIS